MSKLDLVEVTKRFGKVLAVDNLSLNHAHGEFLCLVGPSACGKTTTLRLIAGVEKPDRGEIYIEGELVNDIPPERRGVHVVYQDYALWPNMKVFEEKGFSNLGFPLRIRNLQRQNIRSRVDEISQLMGIRQELYPRRPYELSGGEQQRVAMGRALTIVPRILLLDEPLIHLDPPSKLKVRDELRRLHEELKMTTIYVTHNLADALAMGDRVAVMNEGRIVQITTPQILLNHPANDFVADFIRASFPPQHLLPERPHGQS